MFSALIDALLPPHEDVRLARTVTEKEYAQMLAPREAGVAWIVALFPYRDKRIRALVRAVKYYGETRALEMPARYLGEYILEVIAEKKLLGGWEEPIIVPMPSSRERMRERGYNQVERLAKILLPILGSSAEYAPHVLSRENRESQVHVGRPKRAENIRGAFFVPDQRAVSGKFVVLIDDVVESGSTFADARRALRKAGAKGVIGVALAH